MLTTPGSTTASRLRASILRMRFSLVSTINTASLSASAPPERPVPAPRGTNGMPRAPSRRTTAMTSSRLPGSTTTPGTRRWVGNPSFAYVTRSGSAVRTCRGPTISASVSTNDAKSRDMGNSIQADGETVRRPAARSEEGSGMRFPDPSR